LLHNNILPSIPSFVFVFFPYNSIQYPAGKSLTVLEASQSNPEEVIGPQSSSRCLWWYTLESHGAIVANAFEF